MDEYEVTISKQLRLSALDYPDPDDLCISVYVTGCIMKCSGCFNYELSDPHQDGEGFVRVNSEKLIELIHKEARASNIDKICLMGGDPLYGNNVVPIRRAVKGLNDLGYKVCIYTGNSIDYVKALNLEGFTFIKSGRYIRSLSQGTAKKTANFMRFASENQELYDSNYKLLTIKGRYDFK